MFLGASADELYPSPGPGDGGAPTKEKVGGWGPQPPPECAGEEAGSKPRRGAERAVGGIC